MACIAIKADGNPCGKVAREGQQRCGVHEGMIIRNGPHTTRINEIKHMRKKELNDRNDLLNANIDAQPDLNRRVDLFQQYAEDARRIRRNYADMLHAMVVLHEEEVRLTGVDPDAEANRRRDENRRHRQEVRQARMHAAWGIRAEAAQVGAAVRVAPAAVAPPVGALQAFAQDSQNVHTTHAVKQTKEIVGRILKIPVPESHKWNMNHCSRTPGEIIIVCKLSPSAAWQMTAKYCQADDVYELGRGIYGQVLDCVWQYVKNSEHKTDLYRILKTEMEDNVGMCAQGNLSRLTNIVAGYMEGVGLQESVAQILGRLLPPLMEIEDDEERLDKAKKIMDEYVVPDTERESWLEALA